MADKNRGRTRPNEGMISSMMRARNVTSRGARGAVMAAALLAVATPLGVQAEALRGRGAPPPAGPGRACICPRACRAAAPRGVDGRAPDVGVGGCDRQRRHHLHL